jgi:hypothetical protein
MSSDNIPQILYPNAPFISTKNHQKQGLYTLYFCKKRAAFAALSVLIMQKSMAVSVAFA